MTRRALCLVLLFATWHVGCAAPPRIDTSSEARAIESLKQVRESLPADKRPDFDAAVMTVALERLGEDAPREMAGDPDTISARLLEPLNGMTAHEVLTEAQRIDARENEARRAKQDDSKPMP
jgi:hypothetical protein